MRASNRLVGLALLSIAMIMSSCGERPPADALSNPNVIYGEDGRRDLYQLAPGDPSAAHAEATVALVKKTDLAPAASGMTLPRATFGSAYNLCADEPYREQPNPAFCSGFLVAPDIIVTAGHCLTSALDCANVAFVFGFGYASATSDVAKVNAANVFHCRELIATQAPSAGADFAVVRLNRAVTGRRPVAFRASGKIEDQAPLIVIGHPSGLPTKVAGGAAVRSNVADGYFVSNLDTYGGNSGSAVFHGVTGVVEGILVRGEQDFTTRGTCTTSNRCAGDACRGEDVTRATAFAIHIPANPPPGEATMTHVFAPLSLAIPDNNAVGATQSLTVSQTGQLTNVSVKIQIKHSYIGDLQVILYHPDGTAVTLHNRTGGSKDDLVQTYGTGGLAINALSSLKTKSAAGAWKLLIRDRAAVDIGTLVRVELVLSSQ